MQTANADVLYIGKSSNIRRRIRELIRFGYGERSAHWGGRYLWQVDNCERFIIAYREEALPEEAERFLLSEFHVCYGKYPFANHKA